MKTKFLLLIMALLSFSLGIKAMHQELTPQEKARLKELREQIFGGIKQPNREETERWIREKLEKAMPKETEEKKD